LLLKHWVMTSSYFDDLVEIVARETFKEI
jgi:hypothetical protein